LAESLALLEHALPTCFVTTLSAAIARWAPDVVPPDLLVLLQSHSGQFLESDLLRLRSRMPLARTVAVLGSWCEGEMRSGRPLVGVRRVSWHLWPVRLARELAAWQAGGGGTWALPATAAEEELLLEAAWPALRPSGLGNDRPIAVRTSNADFAACLVQGLARCGRQAVVLLSGQASAAELFSALIDDLRLPADGRELSNLYRQWRPRPIVALADFPRLHDERLIREAGAALLLAKPLDLAELAAQLDRLLNKGDATGSVENM
jgi:CheY-like chemotaxis protein